MKVLFEIKGLNYKAPNKCQLSKSLGAAGHIATVW